MNDSKPARLTLIGRAIRKATGIKRIRAAKISVEPGEAVQWTVTFLPTDEQIREFGKALSEMDKLTADRVAALEAMAKDAQAAGLYDEQPRK